MMPSNRPLSFNSSLTTDLGGPASNLCHLFEQRSEPRSWLRVTCVQTDSPERSSETTGR